MSVRKGFQKILFSLLLAAEITVLTDLGAALAGGTISRRGFYALFGLLFLLLLVWKRARGPVLRGWFRGILIAGILTLLVLGGFLFGFSRAGAYRRASEEVPELFAGKRVLVVAPHEDDELNIAGGVMEEYLRCGSQVYVLFTTNGDYLGQGEKRIGEALKVAHRLGLQEDHVIFLGYGDGWQPLGSHIYSAAPDQPMTSMAGRTETYGSGEHPAYRNGRLYTRTHLLEDLRDAILELRPDLILCTEYEPHPDHRAASLFLEEAMRQILRQEQGYHPLLLKSISYHTAYYAPRDFYAANILSTRNPFDTQYLRDIHIFDWSDRIRLPVSTDTLSRSMLSSSSYWQLRLYGSQGAANMAEGIISGDKVFWLRDTNSLCYDAKVTASGDAEKLTDFKLLDAEDLAEDSPTDGTWIPDAADQTRQAQLRFPEPRELTEIRLYDNPSLTDNVLEAEIRLDGGEPIRTGALLPTGRATVISLEQPVTVQTLTVRLMETEGERAGLTEIEAYDGPTETGLRGIKLINADGDFVYDYYVQRSGRESFGLYSLEGPVTLTEEEFLLNWDDSACSAWIEDGRIQVNCPPGKTMKLTVRSTDGSLFDSVILSNPGRFLRSTAQPLEQTLRRAWDCRLPQSNAFLMVRDVYRLARYGSTEGA